MADQREQPELGNQPDVISSCDVYVVNDVPHPRHSGGFYADRSVAYMVYPTVPIVENESVHLIFRTVPGAHHLDGLLIQSRNSATVGTSQTERSYMFSYRSYLSDQTRGTPRRSSLSGGDQLRTRFLSYRNGNRRSDHRYEPIPTRSRAKCNPFTARQFNDGQSLVEGVSAMNITLQTPPSQPPPQTMNQPHYSASPSDFAIPSTSHNLAELNQDPTDEEDDDFDAYDGYDSL